jgi:predicted transcriptional regulator
MEKSKSLTPPELRILYVLLKHSGKSSFDHVMSECGMCYGMFHNNANLLLEKGLITQGATFKDFAITPSGRRIYRDLTENILQRIEEKERRESEDGE